MAERSPHRIWTDWQPAGLRFSQFYNTARCCPSRASLLTGLYPHQADIGHMMDDDGVDGYAGDLNTDTLTIAEALGEAGYRAYMSGKWHLTRHVDGPKHNWPCQRGFDSFFGIITGACSYYHPSTLTRNNERIDTPPGEFFLTDAISDEAADQLRRHAETHPNTPFFQYVAYTAPTGRSTPTPKTSNATGARFDRGWDTLRAERLERLTKMGLIHPNWRLTPHDPSQPAWQEAEHQGVASGSDGDLRRPSRADGPGDRADPRGARGDRPVGADPDPVLGR